MTTDHDRREREWLESEIELAASLTDHDRIRILRDLLRTVDAIRRTKTPQELELDEEVRRALEEVPGRTRYRNLVERFG